MNFERLINIGEYIEPLLEEVIEGERNALDLIALSKVLEKWYKICKHETVLSSAIEEMNKYSEKETVTRHSFKFEKRNSTKYNYKNVPAWNAVNEEIGKHKELQKEIESISKNLNSKGGGTRSYLNEITGEVLEVNQCQKIVHETIVVKNI